MLHYRFICFISVFCANLHLIGQTVANIGGLRYIIQEESAIVGRQNKELSGDIVIPEFIEYNNQQYAVTEFVEPTNLTAWSSNTVTTEGGAFQSCDITSIIIPSTITSIANGAFSGCSKLSSVTLPPNLKSIGAASFSNCTSLETLSIPETVTDFGGNSSYGFVSYSFGNCSNLRSINIPKGVSILYEGCFMGCGLDSIFIPNTIKTLKDNSLALPKLRVVKMGVSDLSKLSYSKICFSSVSKAKLYVPKGSINVYQEYEPWSDFQSMEEYGEGEEVFIPTQINVNIDGLKYILKDGVATVGRQSSTLSGNVKIPENIYYNDEEYPVTHIIEPTDLVCYSGNTIQCTGGAFQGTLIESVSIPKTITIIPAGAFQNCKQLREVKLPENLTRLSAASFAGCAKLENINIPNGLTDLASNTAYGYRSYVFGGCKKLTNIVIPDGVTKLASGCFLNSGIVIRYL